MRQSVRWSFAAVSAVAVAFLLPSFGSSATSWQTGDVFVGVGRERVNAGEIRVFTPTGQSKETLTDPFAGTSGTTTGCAIGPPQVGDALYLTTFANRLPTVFSAVSPHTASQPVSVPPSVTVGATTYTIEATESVVFDQAGNYYVGALPPARDSANDPVQPYGFIFKFAPSNTLLATYPVPNGFRGADWIDLGTDQVTLYYTSEGSKIHVFRPATAPGGAFYQELQIRENNGTPVGGVVYALRLLPPSPHAVDNPATPIDESLAPSGFLVAHNSGPIRLSATGEVVIRYPPAPNVGPGQYFALNITPDGQSLWTATFQDDPDDNNAPAAGRLIRYHIPTATVTALVNTGAPSVWGVCVKREYTAGINACYQMDSAGNPVLDAGGNPVPVAGGCKPAEVCDGRDDDDGDGLPDGQDPDCRPPGAPTLALVDQHNIAGDTIVPLQLQATDPEGDPLTFSVTGLPPGLSATSSGLVTGTLPFGSDGGSPYTVTVSVTDGTNPVSGTFQWHVTHRNGPPTLSNPGPMQLTVDKPAAPIAFTITDPDLDSVFVEVTGLPAGMHLVGQSCATPTSCTTYDPLTAATPIGPSPYYALQLVGTPDQVGVYPVTISIRDHQGSVPLCQGPPSLDCRSWVTQAFVVTVVNRPPVFAVANQTSLVNVPIAPLTIVATDPDGHTPLTYAISTLPAGLIASVTSAGIVITGTPTQLTASIDPLGMPITVTVTDASGAATTVTFRWIVIDNQAPVCERGRPSQALWPPNHKFVPIRVLGVTDPDGDPVTIAITGIAQDEPLDTKGDGRTEADGRIDGATAWVRAERTGVKAIPGDGRVYEISFTASDGRAGGTCSGSILVGVPHDQGQRSLPIDSLKRWNSITGQVIVP